MATVHLRIGDLVWGKLGRYPPWPGKVVSPPKDLKKPRGKKCFFVKFFGTEDHAWIKVEQLKPYHPHKEEMIKINKGKRFQQAVDAVEEYLKKAKGKDQAHSDDKSKSDKGRKAAKPMKIIEEDDEDAFKGGSSDKGNFKPDYYLKHIQKDLRLAISMGDSVNHPTPMAAAANEVYKRAKALDQSDNDMSAVYRAYIH
ncbi:oxidoreductase GLYR1 isoform X3 [Labeo rohita]|uniref:Oxidoreductase GLYR1 isoform X3 n=1 Tax=Labeo rohita TaxID=84645 RepID=A0A498NMT6_LABRO|nr:oxidoreductase GLYR1 isoform X3 [Labeo rohita]